MLKSFNKYDKIIILIVSIILCQNPIWPIWDFGLNISFLLVMSLFLMCRGQIIRQLNKPIIFLNIILLCLIFILIPLITGFMFSNIICIMCYLLIFSIPHEKFSKAFMLLTKIYAYILLFSFVPWLINTYIGEVFPVYNLIDLSEMKGGGTATIMKNYFFFVDNGNSRFYSIFDEPGVVGTLSAFILYGHKYNFKVWYVWAIFICSLFTFSLAFYILTAIGFLYSKIRNVNTIITSLIAIVILLCLVGPTLLENEGFQKSILYRISDDSADGRLDSRTNYEATLFLENIEGSIDYYIGIGKKIDEYRLREGASYKLFILERGFFAVLVLLLCYYSFIRKNKTMDNLFLLILFGLSFLQRPHIFTAWQMLLFYSIVSHFIVLNKLDRQNLSMKES